MARAGGCELVGPVETRKGVWTYVGAAGTVHQWARTPTASEVREVMGTAPRKPAQSPRKPSTLAAPAAVSAHAARLARLLGAK